MQRIAILLIVLVLAGAAALAQKRKSDPGPHPLKLIKALWDPAGRRMNATRGNIKLWLQNVADVPVDKIKVEVEILDQNGHLEETISREIPILDAGAKKTFDLTWSVIGEEIVKPRIWVYYNGGLDRLTQFEAVPENW